MPGLQTTTISKTHVPDVTVAEICFIEYYIFKRNIFKITIRERRKVYVAVLKNAIGKRGIIEGALIHF
jgi:hypothetical protein